MTTELQAAAAEIEQKENKRMTEKELEAEAHKISYAMLSISGLRGEIINLAKKYRGAS